MNAALGSTTGFGATDEQDSPAYQLGPYSTKTITAALAKIVAAVAAS